MNKQRAMEKKQNKTAGRLAGSITSRCFRNEPTLLQEKENPGALK